MFEFFKRKKKEKKLLEQEISELQTKKNKLEEQYNLEKMKFNSLDQSIANLEKKEQHLRKVIDTKSLEYIDQLDGLEFEKYTKKLLQQLGYKKVEVTKFSGDYGIDILAEKDFVTYAIQCKKYSSTLGNDCVQEAYSGKEFYGKDLAVVLTNSTFTPAAKELAKKTNVLLWDRSILEKMLKQVNGNINIIEENLEECDFEDPLYDDVVEFVITTGKASSSLLQRRFKFGYNRAARMIDVLEKRGIIGPQNGSKPREVLVNYNE